MDFGTGDDEGRGGGEVMAVRWFVPELCFFMLSSAEMYERCVRVTVDDEEW